MDQLIHHGFFSHGEPCTKVTLRSPKAVLLHPEEPKSDPWSWAPDRCKVSQRIRGKRLAKRHKNDRNDSHWVDEKGKIYRKAMVFLDPKWGVLQIFRSTIPGKKTSKVFGSFEWDPEAPAVQMRDHLHCSSAYVLHKVCVRCGVGSIARVLVGAPLLPLLLRFLINTVSHNPCSMMFVANLQSLILEYVYHHSSSFIYI